MDGWMSGFMDEGMAWGFTIDAVVGEGSRHWSGAWWRCQKRRSSAAVQDLADVRMGLGRTG